MILLLLAAAAAVGSLTNLQAAQEFQTEYETALVAGRMKDACQFADNVLVLAYADGAIDSASYGPEITKELAVQIVTGCGNTRLSGDQLTAAILRSQAMHHMLASWGNAVRAGVEKRRAE